MGRDEVCTPLAGRGLQCAVDQRAHGSQSTDGGHGRRGGVGDRETKARHKSGIARHDLDNKDWWHGGSVDGRAGQAALKAAHGGTDAMALGGRPQNQELDAWRQEKADLLKKMNEETRAMSAAMAPRHSEKLRMLARDHEYLDELDGLDEKERPRAKEVLAEEERKVAVRLGLCAAVDANNVDALRVTIKEGLAAGLGSEDLEEAMEALERKVAWGLQLIHGLRPHGLRTKRAGALERGVSERVLLRPSNALVRLCIQGCAGLIRRLVLRLVTRMGGWRVVVA